MEVFWIIILVLVLYIPMIILISFEITYGISNHGQERR